MQKVYTLSDPCYLHVPEGFSFAQMDLSDYSDAELSAELVRRRISPSLNGSSPCLPLSYSPPLNPHFLKPTRKGSKGKPKNQSEVVSYCLSVGLAESDGEWMWCHWQDNGFTINQKPIKDWKLVIQAWKKAGYLPRQKNGKPKPTHDSLGRFLGERTTNCLGQIIRPPPPSLSEEEFQRRMQRSRDIYNGKIQ